MFFFAQNAYANIGLPMVFIGLPFLFLAFIPVMIIEMMIYHKQLSLSYKKAGWGSFWANIITTLLGYPVSWGLHVLIGMLIGYPLGYVIYKFIKVEWLQYILFPLISAWLMPNVDTWHICLAGIFGLVPAFFISVLIERKFLRMFFKEVEADQVNKAVWKANKITYSLLALFLGVMTTYHLLVKYHAFDFLRNRADEAVAFKVEPIGDVWILSSPDILKIDPVQKKTQAFSYKTSEELKDARFEKHILTSANAWMTDQIYKDEHREILYRYDLQAKEMQEVSSWPGIEKIEPVKGGIVVVADGSYSYENREDLKGIYFVSSDGQIKELLRGDLKGNVGDVYVSPLKDKAVYSKMLTSQKMEIYDEKPFWLRAQLRLYDFVSGKDTLIDEFSVIEEYATLKNLSVSWHPNGQTFYYSKMDFDGSWDQFAAKIGLEELKVKYRNDKHYIEYKIVYEVLNEVKSMVKMQIYAYNGIMQRKEFFHAGQAVVGWLPDGNQAIIETGKDPRETVVYNFRTKEEKPFAFNHLRKKEPYQVSVSTDGNFLFYLGDSEHFLDQHHYRERSYWAYTSPRWLWIKEVATGKERKYDILPFKPAYDIKWDSPSF